MVSSEENYAEVTFIAMASSAENVSSGLSAKNTTFISFICQQCYQPLKIDNSIRTLDLDSCLELESEILDSF